MIFTKETHKQIFDGFMRRGCVIRSLDRQVYLLVEDNDEKIKGGELPSYWFVYTFNEQEDPNKRLYATQRIHLDDPKISYSHIFNETIGVDLHGEIFSIDASGNDREEDRLPLELNGSELRAFYTDVKTVGDSMYAIGVPHLLYKRNGVNDWENISESIPLVQEYVDGKLQGKIFGWRDLDGFSEQDIYLAGGEGEIWHYDGSDFKQCDFPSNERVRNVCCAGDGYVYIGGKRGRLWKGKNDTWELVSEKEFSVIWRDIAWFKGRLFLGSDYGLWEFKDSEVIRAEVPDQVLTCSGSLSICPEKKYLLTAGNNGASMYDGKEWTVLFDRFDLPD